MTREEASEKIKFLRDNVSHFYLTKETEDALCMAIEALNEDVAPIKHAHWKDCEIKLFDGIDEYETYRCSECDSLSFNKSKYCPNCGAKMDFEEIITNDRFKEEQ